VEKARASRAHHARRSVGRAAAKVQVRRVRVRFERAEDAVKAGAEINPVRGKKRLRPGASRDSGSSILGGKSAVRVAVEVGRGSLVIVIVHENLKQESCI
jgi:sRNA-binding protein